MAASFSFSRIVSILLKLSLAAASFNVGYVFAIDFQLLWLISLFDFLSIMANAIPNLVAFAVISIFVLELIRWPDSNISLLTISGASPMPFQALGKHLRQVKRGITHSRLA